MIDMLIEIPIAPNLDRLNEELAATLGDAGEGRLWYGVSSTGREVIVHLADTATAEQSAVIRSVVQRHDATQLTAHQQAEQTRKALLEVMRTANTTALDEAAFASTPDHVQTLARKIAWLEQEVIALRLRG